MLAGGALATNLMIWPTFSRHLSKTIADDMFYQVMYTAPFVLISRKVTTQGKIMQFDHAKGSVTPQPLQFDYTIGQALDAPIAISFQRNNGTTTRFLGALKYDKFGQGTLVIPGCIDKSFKIVCEGGGHGLNNTKGRLMPLHCKL